MDWSSGYQVTDEDIVLAAESAGLVISLDEAPAVMSKLDLRAISMAALAQATDLDEQTTAANVEIVRQMAELGIVSPGPKV